MTDPNKCPNADAPVEGPRSISPPEPYDVADGYCKDSPDKTHCVHWWDGEDPCCFCGDNTDPFPPDMLDANDPE